MNCSENCGCRGQGLSFSTILQKEKQVKEAQTTAVCDCHYMIPDGTSQLILIRCERHEVGNN